MKRIARVATRSLSPEFEILLPVAAAVQIPLVPLE